MSIPTTSGHWPSGLAYTAALIFTLASAGTNLVYGWQKGSDVPSSVIWATVSAAVFRTQSTAGSCVPLLFRKCLLEIGSRFHSVAMRNNGPVAPP